jgi:GATA zinc finger
LLQDSLLGDGFLAGASGSPGMCALLPVSLPSFPCFADEMEEQAKAMEYDLLSSAAQDPLKTQQQNIPALKPRGGAADEASPQRVMVPINSFYPGGSRGNGPSSHPENHQRGFGGSHQQQQSQQKQHHTLAATLQPPSVAAGSSGSAPLAAALHNADCIRSGFSSPWTGGWLGCRSGPWCNRERCHIGQCNTRATIPGLSAYLPEELAAVGLPAVVELTAPLPPAAAAVALAAATAAATVASGGAAAADVLASLGKRKFGFGGGAGTTAAATALSSGESLTASDNNSYNGDEAEQQQQLMTGSQGKLSSVRTSKRKKAPGGGDFQITGGAAIIGGGDFLDGGATTDNEAVSEELKSSMTGEAKLRSVPTPCSPTKGSVLKKGGKNHGRKGKKYNKGPRRNALPTTGVHFVDPSAPIMIAGDTQLSSMPMVIAPDVSVVAVAGAVGVAGPGSSAKANIPRAPNGRRAPQVWISGECTDPRTGMLVSAVPPASFCTQCSATSTPVWRAGPFGHKTLCNACGVRWMKVAPRSRK